MTQMGKIARSPWTNAVDAAALFAVDAVGTAGVTVRARPGPVRDQWLALVRELLPVSSPMRRVPHHVNDGRMLGGLDLAATLQAGRPVAERGVLEDVDGGVLVLPTAERLPAAMAARIGSVIDSREVVLERDGLAKRMHSSFGVILLDEGIDDERPPAGLIDRLAFQVDLDAIRWSEAATVSTYDLDDILAAQERLPRVQESEDIARAMCEAAMLLGIASLRAPLLALRAARAAAALAGRSTVSNGDAELAAALVLAPRATMLPAAETSQDLEDDATSSDAEAESSRGDDPADDGPIGQDRPLGDIVLEAAQAAIPAGLLAQLQLAAGLPTRGNVSGRAGATQSSLRRGRPAGVRRGEPRAGARLNVVETLRAAAPWQALRQT